ncbi:MAG: imidazole glycerol phosphate synthase subunit HisH [Acidobacteriota bacterium]
MVVIIDYKAGNLYNVAHALKYLGKEFNFSSDPAVVRRASKVILPGVGSARPAMESLGEQNLIEALQQLDAPFLGICLGMQLLFEGSEEEQTPCLGIIPGTVKKFDNAQVKVPHIGWNQVRQMAVDGTPNAIFRGLPEDGFFYFVHSFYVPQSTPGALAVTDYSVPFVSAVQKDNFWGVQFHTERSGEFGLRLLRNFLEAT